MGVQRFEDLEVWQEARELCRVVRDITRKGEFARDFRLRDQIRGSSGSVMDCIAEGFERGGNREFVQFLSISKGSCGETRSQAYRAFDYEYVDRTVLDELLNRTSRLGKKIWNLMSHIRGSDLRGIKFRKQQP
jgi:four helix bundle protein